MKWYHVSAILGIALFFYAGIRMINIGLSVMNIMDYIIIGDPSIDGQVIALCFALGFLIAIFSLSYFDAKKPKVVNGVEK